MILEIRLEGNVIFYLWECHYCGFQQWHVAHGATWYFCRNCYRPTKFEDIVDPGGGGEQ